MNTVLRIGLHLFLCIGLSACDQGGAQGAIFQVELIDGQGLSATRDVDRGTLFVHVHHADELSEPLAQPIEGGDFSLDFPLQSFTAPTRIALTINEDGGPTLIGAVPSFEPIGAGPLLRVIMAEPDTCNTLGFSRPGSRARLRLGQRRRSLGYARRRALSPLVGGVTESGSSGLIERIDPVSWDMEVLADAASIGAARGLGLDLETSLFLGQERSLLLAFSAAGPPVELPLTLHAGAGNASALISLGPEGAAIVGGDNSSQITWVGVDGEVRATTSLSMERANAVAGLVDGGILIIGGTGQEGAEWAPILGDGVALTWPVPAFASGWLLESPSGDGSLWLEEGRSETWLIGQCATECVLEPGPQWQRPRRDLSIGATEAGVTWLVGGMELDQVSNAIDLLSWQASGPSLSPGPDLAEPRAQPVVFEHAQGIVTIAGGQGMDGLLDDFELCFPTELDPL